MFFLERLGVIKDDPLPPDRVDVAIGVGIDVSADFQAASPYSRAIAQKAAALYYGGRVDHVLFTGGYPVGRDVNEALAMRRLAARKVREDRLFVETESQRTWQQADGTLRIMKAHGWRSAIVIAQQWHARRVRATFRRRWKGSGCRIYVVKAFSEYGGGSREAPESLRDVRCLGTVAFIISKIVGHA